MQRRRLRATLTKIPTEIARHIFCQEGRTVVMSILTLTQQNLATRTIDHSMTWNPSLQTMLLEGIRSSSVDSSLTPPFSSIARRQSHECRWRRRQRIFRLCFTLFLVAKLLCDRIGQSK